MKPLLLLLLLLALAPGTPPGAWAQEGLFQSAGVVPPRERRPAPDFSLPTLDGRTESLKAHRGKVVLLNFWATWCTPCRKEFPAMEALYRRFRDRGLILLAVSVDRDPRAVRRFAAETGVSFPILLDPEQKVRRRYFIRAFPTTYFIGRDGRFLGVAVGERIWNGSAMVRLVEKLLGGDSLPGPRERSGDPGPAETRGL